MTREALDQEFPLGTLGQLFLDLGIEPSTITIAIAGDTLVLNGAVASYDQKLIAERAAKQAGFRRVENALRVVPALLQ
jgi:osmotically-inducible protein OsmY